MEKTDLPHNRPQFRGRKPLNESRIERNGLPAGTVAPEFTLNDLYGRKTSISEYRGRRLILIFSDPHCGPCNDLAPHLNRIYRRRSSATEIIMVSRGEADENRQKAEAHGFNFPVVLQDRWKISKLYGIFATPVAFLIGEDGRTERKVAIGFQEIRSLVLNELTPGCIMAARDRLSEISGILSGPLPRRHAFRMAGWLAAAAVLSAIGMEKTADAACNSGYTACGTACCNNSTERCCNSATNACCATSLVCCAGKCCAPGQICSLGRCVQQTQP